MMFRLALLLCAFWPAVSAAGELVSYRRSSAPSAASRDDSETERLRAELAALRAELAAIRSEAKPVVKQPPAEPAGASYPAVNRSIWQRGGVTMNKQQLVQHLAAENIHAGKFARQWLEQLSTRELQALHSDDHEGSVHWSSVERAKAIRSRKVVAPRPCPQ